MSIEMTVEAQSNDSVGLPRAGRALSARNVLPVVERYALVVLLGVLLAFFALLPATRDTFLMVANIRNVAANEVVIAIAALAALVPLIGGQFDVSVDAVLGMVSVAIAALTVRAGLPLGVAVVAGILMGAAVGAVNGFVVAYLRASSFIITLGMATLVGGLVSLYTKDQVILGVPQSLVDFGTSSRSHSHGNQPKPKRAAAQTDHA